MKHKYLKNVATLTYDISKCTGCGRCIEVCPHQVFQLHNNKSEIVDKDACIECGACVKNCPFDALSVQPGVGCAVAIINGWLTGSEPNCDCSGNGCC